MDIKFSISSKLKYLTYVMLSIGLITMTLGLLFQTKLTWAAYLVSNYYFISITIGATFFLALQYVTQSGWSSMFKRVPEAMSTYLLYGGILFLILLLGVHDIYHWSHNEDVALDPLLTHKAPYLNVPFFAIRILIFFASWVIFSKILRRLSIKEDEIGGIKYFEKSELYSKIFIFVLAITFSLASFDWIMSIDTHWYSTIFALKGFVGAFYHGSAALILIIILLHQKGYYKEMNSSHLLDFSRYLFMLSIVFGYLWFAEFMLIWYGNIPEETIYYYQRWNNGWEWFFYMNIAVNWFIPFVVLLSQKANRNIHIVKWISILLLFGHWVDIYIQIMPGIAKDFNISYMDIGLLIGIAGLFIFIVTKSLSKANLIPKNHPYLEESLHHHIH